MSLWSDYDFEARITAILNDAPVHMEGYHLGRPFLTPYQIAIEFERRHPDDFQRIRKPIGGVGTGQQDSLPQYIGQQLSMRIKDGRIQHIEGAILSSLDVKAFQFAYREKDIQASLTDSGYPLSMYRLRET